MPNRHQSSAKRHRNQMSHVRKRRVMLAVAAAAVVAGAIVAGVSASGGSHHHTRSALTRGAGPGVPRPSELAAAASYLGITTTQLRKELQSGRTLAQIADATSGRSAAGLIDALVSPKAARLRAAVNANGPSAARDAKKLTRLRRRVTAKVDGAVGYPGLSASARYLGVSAAQLLSELHAGRSLAQIANATAGRSAAGLIGARVSAREAQLRAAVASGSITRKTEHALLSGLRARVAGEVDRTPSP
jgi:hypothetical protein